MARNRDYCLREHTFLSSRSRFDALVAEHQSMVARICASYERDRDLARELSQDVWFAIWRALPNYRAHAFAESFMTEKLRSTRWEWVSIIATCACGLAVFSSCDISSKPVKRRKFAAVLFVRFVRGW
jgi:hypothetical protein